MLSLYAFHGGAVRSRIRPANGRTIFRCVGSCEDRSVNKRWICRGTRVADKLMSVRVTPADGRVGVHPCRGAGRLTGGGRCWMRDGRSCRTVPICAREWDAPRPHKIRHNCQTEGDGPIARVFRGFIAITKDAQNPEPQQVKRKQSKGAKEHRRTGPKW